MFWCSHELDVSLQALSWTQNWSSSVLWASPAACPLSSLTPSVLWSPPCSAPRQAPSPSEARWPGPSVAQLQPILAQQKPHTTFQVRLGSLGSSLLLKLLVSSFSHTSISNCFFKKCNFLHLTSIFCCQYWTSGHFSCVSLCCRSVWINRNRPNCSKGP